MIISDIVREYAYKHKDHSASKFIASFGDPKSIQLTDFYTPIGYERNKKTKAITKIVFPDRLTGFIASTKDINNSHFPHE